MIVYCKPTLEVESERLGVGLTTLVGRNGNSGECMVCSMNSPQWMMDGVIRGIAQMV